MGKIICKRQWAEQLGKASYFFATCLNSFSVASFDFKSVLSFFGLFGFNFVSLNLEQQNAGQIPKIVRI
jgi:hypothetical protein